jgi:cyanate permease
MVKCPMSLRHTLGWSVQHTGAILGFLEIGSGLGGTIGPWLSGFLFDRAKSYTVSFRLSMAVLVLATVSA